MCCSVCVCCSMWLVSPLVLLHLGDGWLVATACWRVGELLHVRGVPWMPPVLRCAASM